MSDRAPALGLPVVVAALAAAWCPSAAADPLACQARAAYESSPTPVEVTFQALTAGGNPPLSFFWDFGDGGTSTEQNPVHTYAEAGLLQVVLVVTDADAAECRDTVLVSPGIAVDPVCLISADPRWSESSDPIQFDAQPGFIPDPPPYSWTWTFGDGTTSDEQSPQHSYAVPGTYWAAVMLHTSIADRQCGTIRVTTLVPQVVGTGGPLTGARLRLDPPRPNPSKMATTLGFTLPRAGRARLAILDASGRRIRILVDDVRPAGPQAAVWQGHTDEGRPVPAGLYFAVLEHAGVTQAVSVVRLR